MVNTPAFGSKGPKFEFRSPAATLCAAVFEVVETVTYILMKFIFTVYHPVFRMRRQTEAPSQSPNWFRLIKLNAFLLNTLSL